MATSEHADHVIGIGLKYEFDKEELKPENFDATRVEVLAKVLKALNEMHEHYMQFHQ